jgi:hypothetical protein
MKIHTFVIHYEIEHDYCIDTLGDNHAPCEIPCGL